MKILLHFLYLLVAFTIYLSARYMHLNEGHKAMCLDLKEKFVEGLSPKEHSDCLNIFNSVFTYKQWETKMNSWLGQWGWSHLMVYAPSESQEIWESKSFSTGVKVKVIEGEYLVYRAHKESEFQKGDILLAFNGSKNLDMSIINNKAGTFTVKRNKKELNLKVKLKEYTWDDRVKVKSPYFIVPSFRGEFFDSELMVNFSEQLRQMNSDVLYIDLRGNYGGNIVSGMRFLSFFLCSEEVIGKFILPANKGKGESWYPDVLNHVKQLDVVDNSERVKIKIPKNEYCYKGKFEVLTDSGTSSTAEMVALALREFKNITIRGQLTSGQMVLSSWEPVKNFPEGYLYSFPYAVYESSKGALIEGSGIVPDIEKGYVLSLESQAKDSFIN